MTTSFYALTCVYLVQLGQALPLFCGLKVNAIDLDNRKFMTKALDVFFYLLLDVLVLPFNLLHLLVLLLKIKLVETESLTSSIDKTLLWKQVGLSFTPFRQC